jgi:GNAT superfamily N-acetyltransferase
LHLRVLGVIIKKTITLNSYNIQSLMKIRIAEQGDANDLVPLFEQLGYACSAGEIASRIAQQITPGRDTVLVAEGDGSVCGVIALHVHSPIHETGKWALISSFVVDESVRGHGVGAKLLKAAEQHALALGCTQVELSSSEARVRAHAFYEQYGYSEKRKRFVRAPLS